MHNLGVVFGFELRELMHKKPYIISTIIIGAVILFLAVSPVLLRSLFTDDTNTQDSLEGGVFYEDTALAGILPFDDGTYDSEDALRQAVKDGDETIGYVIEDATHIKTIYNNYSMSDESKSYAVLEMLKQIYITQSLTAQGVPPQTYQSLQSTQIENETVILGKNTANQYIAGMVFVLLVYMIVLLYGQTVASAIAREKDSKTMELLITTTDPGSLILGKVFAVITASLLAFAVYLICALVPYQLLHGSYPEKVTQFLHSTISGEQLGIYILYFVLSLFLYMFIFAALGSLVSRVEDVGSSVSPIILLLVIAYALAFVVINGIDSTIIHVASWIPFFSVLLMPLRFASGTIAWTGIAVSTVISLAFTALMAWVSIKIYRRGTLNYGTRMRLTQAVRQAFRRK